MRWIIGIAIGFCACVTYAWLVLPRSSITASNQQALVPTQMLVQEAPTPTLRPLPPAYDLSDRVIGTVATTRLNLRSVPDANAAILATLDQDSTMLVKGRLEGRPWLHVQPEGTGPAGWVSSDYVVLNKPVSDVPLLYQDSIPTPTPVATRMLPTLPPPPANIPVVPPARPTDWQGWKTTPTVESFVLGTVLAQQLNIRKSPNTDSVVVGTLTKGMVVVVVARDFESNWVFVVGQDKVIGWVNGNPDYLLLNAPFESLPYPDDLRFQTTPTPRNPFGDGGV